ncbi:MAG: hypothetical protein SXV54_16780 [Chloroflexota bacterium]|nr:hypothetical protein [Chloroflexota bacterium]
MIHPELLWMIAKERNKDMMRDAEQWRLLRSFSQPTWLTRQIRGLLCQMGCWLIRIGRPQRQQTDLCQHERLIP